MKYLYFFILKKKFIKISQQIKLKNDKDVNDNKIWNFGTDQVMRQKLGCQADCAIDNNKHLGLIQNTVFYNANNYRAGN